MPSNSQFTPAHGAAPPNPATLSTPLAGLFAPGVVAAELRTPADPALLFPEEAASLARAVPKRVGEFAGGRLAARRALAELGIVDFPLRVGPDRRPLWPDAVVGSITHTEGLCAAVAAGQGAILSLGLDTELAGEVKRELWRGICVGAEIAWLESLPQALQSAFATLIFSAKESFYKCQYPLTGQFLSFADVCVAPVGAIVAASGEGSFAVSPTRPLALFERTRAPVIGRYRFHERYVSTGVTLKEDPGGAP